MWDNNFCRECGSMFICGTRYSGDLPRKYIYILSMTVCVIKFIRVTVDEHQHVFVSICEIVSVRE